jgi:hypothetical protein
MIGALRYFASRFFAPRYWPKVGAGTGEPDPIVHEFRLRAASTLTARLPAATTLTQRLRAGSEQTFQLETSVTSR